MSDDQRTDWLSGYYEGCRDALKRFAWWKDGIEYVGSTGYTLAQALADVEKAQDDCRSYEVGL